jgi:Cu/Zn superoxide dismutase
MLAAGAFGYALFSPSTSGAQTTTTVPAAGNKTTPGAGAFHSNEDPTHEKGESAQREADENSGKAFAGGGPRGHFTPNEDPTHEKNESAAREAQENAGQAPTAP